MVAEIRLLGSSEGDLTNRIDGAKSLEPSHRTHGREAIQVRAVLPPPPPAGPDAPLPGTAAETDRVAEALRRAIRLGGLAYTT